MWQRCHCSQTSLGFPPREESSDNKQERAAKKKAEQAVTMTMIMKTETSMTATVKWTKN